MPVVHSLVNKHLMPSQTSRAKRFYLSNNSHPRCRNWVEVPDDDPFKWIIISILTFCLLLLVFIIITALTFQRSKIYAHHCMPTIFRVV